MKKNDTSNRNTSGNKDYFNLHNVINQAQKSGTYSQIDGGEDENT